MRRQRLEQRKDPHPCPRNSKVKSSSSSAAKAAPALPSTMVAPTSAPTKARTWFFMDGEVRSDFTWYRRSAAIDRKVDQISPHELANLFRSIVRQSFAIDRKELAIEALEVLGYSRKVGETVAYVDRVIMWAVENEYCVFAMQTGSLP